MERTGARLGGGVDALARFVSGVARLVRGFAFVTFLAVAAIGSVFARGGLDAAEAVLVLVLLAPPAVLLFFTAGLRELLRLPGRLRRTPAEGSAQLAELASIAGDARRGGLRRTPALLWRLRGVVGSSRDLVGFALPLRVFTPGFLGLTALAGLLSLLLICAGFVALIVLAAG